MPMWARCQPVATLTQASSSVCPAKGEPALAEGHDVGADKMGANTSPPRPGFALPLPGLPCGPGRWPALRGSRGGRVGGCAALPSPVGTLALPSFGHRTLHVAATRAGIRLVLWPRWDSCRALLFPHVGQPRGSVGPWGLVLPKTAGVISRTAPHPGGRVCAVPSNDVFLSSSLCSPSGPQSELCEGPRVPKQRFLAPDRFPERT